MSAAADRQTASRRRKAAKPCAARKERRRELTRARVRKCRAKLPGTAYYSILLYDIVLDQAVKRGYILEHETTNKKQVEIGISAMLKEWAEEDE